MSVLTDEMKSQIRELFGRYPTKQAVTLPALHLVNETLRCVPPEAIGEIAETLDLAPAEVFDTLSFYGFFKDKPHGTIRCWVCRSISCALRGGEEVLAEMCNKLDVEPGGTTSDGRITLEFAECLGACDEAPVMLAGEKRYARLSAENMDEVLARLREG
jgi:NADH-quinone oxidoreductase subunit E